MRRMTVAARSASGWPSPWPPAAGPRTATAASLSGDEATGTTNGAAKEAGKDLRRRPRLRPVHARARHRHARPLDDTGRIRVRIAPAAPAAAPDPDPRKLEAAQACGGLMGGGDGDRQLDPAARDAMVDFARCMREHGIDMLDPTGDGLLLRREGDDGPRPRVVEVPRGRAARDHHLADLGRARNEAGGGS